MPKFEEERTVALPDYHIGKRDVGFGVKETQLAKSFHLNPRAEMAWELMKTISPSAEYLGKPWNVFDPDLITRRVFEMTDHFLAICHFENLVQTLSNPFEVEDDRTNEP